MTWPKHPDGLTVTRRGWTWTYHDPTLDDRRAHILADPTRLTPLPEQEAKAWHDATRHFR